MPVPIHNHTEYSSLDGVSKPKDIVKRCEQCGYGAAACTDHGLVAGHIDFYKTMTKADLHPILGMEAYQAVENRRLKEYRDAFHLILLAKNDVGLRNLWALSTESHRSGFYYHPRTDWELLEQYSEGLICTSACRGGLLQQALAPNIRDDMSESRRALLMSLPDPEKVLLRYQRIFGDDFYIELHTYDSDDQRQVNKHLMDLARGYGVPMVYANDAHYAYPEQYELHEGAICLGEGKKLQDTLWVDAPKHPPCLYIMDEEEARVSLLSHLNKSVVDEAMSNSDLIAEQCKVTIPEARTRLPIFIPEGFKTNKEMLRELAIQGYEKKVIKYGRHSVDYFERFEFELGVIYDANLVDYFLIVRDYVYWAKQNGVMVGPGRGSVGGSLVAYLLGITEVDPLRYGLIFERFYNPGRAGSLPDIDIDFDTEGRERVKQYIVKKYGADRVADIGTVTRMGPKLAIRDIARVLSVPLQDVTQINKILDTTTDAGLLADWAEIEAEVGTELAPWQEKHELLFEWAKELHEYVRTYGVHAAAVIIGDEPLDFSYPLRWVSSAEKLVSQWDMRVAEELGYLKSDLLGLRNLNTLTGVNDELKKRNRPTVDYEALQYMEHDEEMWMLLDRGLTVGLFQVEDGGMARTICREIKPRSVQDLAVMMAMNRPGPLRAGAFERYLEGRGRNTESIQNDKRSQASQRKFDQGVQDQQGGMYDGGEAEIVLHPLVQKVTAETFGVFLYQEQVIHFMVEIGYSLEEADEVRSIMGKKKVELIQQEFTRYRERACNHMDEPTARAIWSQLENFSKYGFNKSHAIEYAIILLWCLYAKYHHPKEFILAGLKTVKKEDRGRWIQEGQRMKIEVLLPDVNESDMEPELVNGRIRLGLTDIKGMGKSHAKWVIDHRPYTSFEQFLEASRKDENKYTLPSGIRKILLDSGRAQKLYDVGAFESIERREISRTEMIAIEQELLGVELSDDSAKVLDKYNEIINELCVPYAAINGSGFYRLAGTIKEVRETKTKKGSPMAWVKLAYDAEQVEFAVWAEALGRYSFLLRPRTPVIVSLKKTDRGMHLEEARILTDA